MEDYDIDSKHDVVLRTLKTVVINKVLFWRIFSYDPEQGKPDFDKLCDVSLEEIPKLAKGATRVHIRSLNDQKCHVTSKPGTDPILRLRQGLSMNLRVNGDGITKDAVNQLWEGPPSAIEHMLGAADPESNHAISYSFYHASENANGLHIINKICCGWRFGKRNAIEIYLDSAPKVVRKLGYEAERKRGETLGGTPKRAVEELQEEIESFRHEGLECYVAFEKTKCKIQESIGKVSKLSPAFISEKLSDARKAAESAMHPSLCLDQVISSMNELDATLKAYRRYGKELKDFKDQTVKTHVMMEHMRLLLLESMKKIPKLSKEGLQAKIDDAHTNAKKFLEPSLTTNQQRMLLKDLNEAIAAYNEQGERLEMLTSKYDLPLRFNLGEQVAVNVKGRWKTGIIRKLWKLGYPYAVLLPKTRKLVWVAEDSDAEIRDVRSYNSGLNGGPNLTIGSRTSINYRGSRRGSPGEERPRASSRGTDGGGSTRAYQSIMSVDRPAHTMGDDAYADATAS